MLGTMIVGAIGIITIILGLKLCVYLYEYLAIIAVAFCVVMLFGGTYFVGWLVIGTCGEIRHNIQKHKLINKRQKKS